MDSQKVGSQNLACYEHMLYAGCAGLKIYFRQQNDVADCSLTNEK